MNLGPAKGTGGKIVQHVTTLDTMYIPLCVCLDGAVCDMYPLMYLNLIPYREPSLPRPLHVLAAGGDLNKNHLQQYRALSMQISLFVPTLLDLYDIDHVYCC
jgi:hypothetical protein